jgi:outer membrane protein assembly factor BamB
LRVIGKTEPVPFITVFATEDMPPARRGQVRRELLAAKRYAALLKLLESKDGFQPFTSPREREQQRSGWQDFRGPGRKGLVPRLPETLDLPRTAWTASLQDRGLGGVTATERWVLATDRDRAAGRDLLKFFDANTGRLALRVQLVRPPAEKPDPKLDYGESIRSSPVIHGNRAYVLDAYGVLFSCPLPQTDAPTREIAVQGIRTQSMVEKFKLSTWGVASTPLLVDDLLVVNVCGTKTSLLALRPDAMQLLWKGPGYGTGYASCIAGTFGGRRQILGYQSASFSGWDVETGSLLWTVRPAVDGDYNVPSPIVVDQHRVLLATENNGTRLYTFDDRGILQPDPTAVNEDVTPDTVTPVAAAGFVYCTSGDTLFRLDLNDGLKTDWTSRDEAFVGHATLLADVDGQRLLVVTYSGELFLFDVSAAVPQLKSRRRPFGLAVDEEIYSHPALVDNRLYLRGTNALMCVVF